MKKNIRVILVLSLSILAVGLTGCGRSYKGAYNGTETVAQTSTQGALTGQPIYQQPGQPAAAQSASQALTITLNDGQGDTVTGVWSSGKDTGTLQMHANGAGFDNVILSINPTVAQPAAGAQTSPYYGSQPTSYYPNSMVADCGGTFTGSLTINGNQLTGTLNSQTNSVCGAQSVSINTTK